MINCIACVLNNFRAECSDEARHEYIRIILLQIEEYDRRLGGDVEIELGESRSRWSPGTSALFLKHDPRRYYDFDHIAPTRLTWKGQDFVDNVRDPAIWRKAKEGALSFKGFTVEFLQDLAQDFIEKQLADQTGIRL